MKTSLAAAFIGTVLAAAPASAQTLVPLYLTGDPETRINYVILADGFTEAELDDFAGHAETFKDLLLTSEPYSRYADFFNVYRIDIASNESGVTSEIVGEERTVDTALGSRLGCFSIDRLLCANGALAEAALQEAAPWLRDDIRLIVVNTTEYGGGGGFWATSTVNEFAGQVFEHEIGHSYAFLDDEYIDPNICARQPGLYGPPGEINATAESTREDSPWSLWIDAETPVPTTTLDPGIPGMYEGGHYCPTGVWRPTDRSLMRSLGQPMEQINSEQFVRRFHQTAGAIDGASPQGDLTLARDETARLAVIPKTIEGEAFDVVWRVNGEIVSAPDIEAGFAANDLVLRFRASRWGVGTHNVTASVSDPTSLVRNDPTADLVSERSWTITVEDRTLPGARLNAAVLPNARTVEPGAAATAFATILNAGDAPATGCSLVLQTSGGGASSASFTYQATDPATNIPQGGADPVFDVPAGGSATFIFSARYSGEVSEQENFISTSCADADPAERQSGVNSTLISTVSGGAPDILTAAATLTPGVASLRSDGRRSAAALSAVNIGSAGDVIVTVDLGSGALPVEALVCETNPADGVCLTERLLRLPVSFVEDEVKTFAVFLRAYGPIPFAPESFRLVFDALGDEGGVEVRRGGTSLAVQTVESAP